MFFCRPPPANKLEGLAFAPASRILQPMSIDPRRTPKSHAAPQRRAPARNEATLIPAQLCRPPFSPVNPRALTLFLPIPILPPSHSGDRTDVFRRTRFVPGLPFP